METPSSTTRTTRSQMSNNKIPISRKAEDFEKGVSKSRQRNGIQDRSVLLDISNDSPIVGLAMGTWETPISLVTKKSNQPNQMTPGSGEALLRDQVKTLLQKVEEEAELSKLSFENPPFVRLQGFNVNSPSLLAPTPMNTPHDFNLSNDVVVSAKESQEEMVISQVASEASEVFEGKIIESEKSEITRSLLLDFSEKSEVFDQGDMEKPHAIEKSDDDDASLWSIQVNASMCEGDNEEDYEETEESNFEDEVEEELLDELCNEMSKINVGEFKGRHTRFVYNSDDELIGEEGSEESSTDSSGVLRLKSLPTPKGKHLLFADEDEEKDQ